MPQPTAVEIIQRLLDRKRRTMERLIKESSHASLDNPYDMATRVARAAEMKGAIDILEEAMEELLAVAAEKGEQA